MFFFLDESRTRIYSIGPSDKTTYLRYTSEKPIKKMISCGGTICATVVVLIGTECLWCKTNTSYDTLVFKKISNVLDPVEDIFLSNRIISCIMEKKVYLQSTIRDDEDDGGEHDGDLEKSELERLYIGTHDVHMICPYGGMYYRGEPVSNRNITGSEVARVIEIFKPCGAIIIYKNETDQKIVVNFNGQCSHVQNTYGPIKKIIKYHGTEFMILYEDGKLGSMNLQNPTIKIVPPFQHTIYWWLARSIGLCKPIPIQNIVLVNGMGIVFVAFDDKVYTMHQLRDEDYLLSCVYRLNGPNDLATTKLDSITYFKMKDKICTFTCCCSRPLTLVEICQYPEECVTYSENSRGKFVKSAAKN